MNHISEFFSVPSNCCKSYLCLQKSPMDACSVLQKGQTTISLTCRIPIKSQKMYLFDENCFYNYQRQNQSSQRNHLSMHTFSYIFPVCRLSYLRNFEYFFQLTFLKFLHHQTQWYNGQGCKKLPQVSLYRNVGDLEQSGPLYARK